MLRPTGQAPTWLYSFVDLAFLLLIAFSQIDLAADPLDLGEIEVPKVRADASMPLPANASERAVVRIHAQDGDGDAPFSVVWAGMHPPDDKRLAAPELANELRRLRQGEALKPLLAPHETSFTKDTLDAIAMIDGLWPKGSRTATISPVSALQ